VSTLLKTRKQKQQEELPLTEKLIQMLLSLPGYQHLPEEELRSIAESLIDLSNIYFSIFQNQQPNDDQK
jgi:dTDP-4-amino-4,6-dideoxygalactose transaminase